MRKMMKVIGIILVIIILLIVIVFVLLTKRPAVPNDYNENVKTGGLVEKTYLEMGNYDVSYFESPAMSSFLKYEIFYPSDLSKSNEKYPVVVFVNGTGVKGTKYQALQKHLASWGFITIATEEEYAWNGFSSEMCVRYISALNEYDGEVNNQKNNFYHKIDLNNIGITGHSQGGIGVINAITDQKHSNIYKAAVSLSSGNKLMSHALQWDYDETLIKTPIMMISSTGDTDSKLVPLNGLQDLYESVPEDVSKIMARRNNADHGEMLYFSDGYVTAWFMYWLKADENAKKAFFDDSAEILSNSLYQDQISNLE